MERKHISSCQHAHIRILIEPLESKYADLKPFACVNTHNVTLCVCVDVFSPFHVGCYRGCYGIYSAVARTLPLNISSQSFHWLAAMMQDSLTPNLSRAPIETCQSALPLSSSHPFVSLLPFFYLFPCIFFFGTPRRLKVERLEGLHLSISISFISSWQRQTTSSTSNTWCVEGLGRGDWSV